MANLFEQFEGADLDRLADCLKAIRVAGLRTSKDLDRLADCLKAIRVAGLRTSKHTQVRVNQSSCNVWVWDEDWMGCVACSIGFDVSWYHSCPECGEEHEFDTYEDLREYVKKYNGKCEQCSPVER